MNKILFDSHCHLTCDALYERMDEIIESANANGVQAFLVIATNFEEFERAQKAQQKFQGIKIALGFHPNDLYAFNEEDYARLETLLKTNQLDALGEIGLDYHWDDVEKEDQKIGFIRQIQLANKYQYPLLIHMREATQDTLTILKEYAQTKFVMHCFSGSKETAKEVMAMNGYLSFAGPLTFKNARGLIDVPVVCDRTRILIETDCPYLTPHPFRGKQNEPKYVVHTFAKLCELLACDEDTLAVQLLDNYNQFLKK